MIDTRRCNAFHPAGCARTPASLTVADSPGTIALDASTHTVYVGGSGVDAGSVTVLDTRRCNAHPSHCAPAGTLKVPGHGPEAIGVNPVTRTLYVATGSAAGDTNRISVFNAATCNATVTTGCGQAPALMTVGPSDGCSFVGLGVNTATNTVYATNTENCHGIGDRVYVYDGRTCNAHDTSGCGGAKATITAGLNPLGIAVDQARHTIYTPLLKDGEDNSAVAVIDTRTCNGTDTSGCGQTPALAPAAFGALDAAIDPTTHRVYVTNVEDTSVTITDGAHCWGSDTTRCSRTPRKLGSDDYPGAIAIDQTVGTAYVTSGVRGTVSALRLARHARRR
jgi:DNA-binding beta-propeller fold protein YncE